MEKSSKIPELLRKQFDQSNFEIVGIIPIPNHGDKLVRDRTLQELIEDFDENNQNDGTVEYLLQLKPKKKKIDLKTDSCDDTVNLPSGKLNIPYLIRNSEILLESGEYSLARNIYNTILRTGESSGFVLYKLGETYEAEGKLEEARMNYEESIAFQATLEAYQKLGGLLVKQSKDRLAAELMERALNLKDLAPSVKYDLYKSIGNCWTRAQKYDEAERSFKKALEIDSSADEIRSNLGALYLQANRIAESKRNFQDAIASNPRNHQALSGLGSCCLAENEKKSAHDYFAEALRIELNNPTALFYLVKCAYEIKSYATAAEILENYIQLAPINTNLLYSLAGLQFHLGRILDAKSTALKIINMQPKHSGAMDLLQLIERYEAPLK